MTSFHFLTFDLSHNSEGVATLEALAATDAGRHPAVMVEVRRVLDWAWRHFPNTHGPEDEGGEWDHDLQVAVEANGWHSVTLTLTGTAHFMREFEVKFGPPDA